MAESVCLGLAALVAGVALLSVAFLVTTGPGSERPSTSRTPSPLLEAGRRRGKDPAEAVTLMARELAWARARRSWPGDPGAWRSPLLGQRILLGWPRTEIESAWLEEVATPLAEQVYARPVDSLSPFEASALVTAMASPRGVRWGLCSDDPRAEAARDALRSGEVDRPDRWALWCSSPNAP